ncbi:MAG: histidine phosphatase family protein [Clostridia bacterium]|nr:histidine phosphatase family protein [Clostridia bacterium]
MNIYIVRHGQTKLNAERKVQARKGEPLNEIGIKQANELKDKFEKEKVNFDLVFSSPQERAIQTAEIVSKKKAIIDNRLDVYDLGTADRMLISEIKMTGIVPDMSIYDGVENVSDYKKRILSFINEIIEKYKNEDVNILIAGHKCTTGMISAYFEKFEVNSIYDDFLKLASKNGEYKKYVI